MRDRELRADLRYLRLVLASQRVGQGFLVDRREGRDERANDPCIPDVDREAFEPGRAQRVRGQRQELEIAFRPGDPSQFDADLRNLPMLPRPPAPPAKDGSLVAESKRRRPFVQARGDHSRDLGRHVGP